MVMNQQLLTAVNKYVHNNNIYDNLIFMGQDKRGVCVVFDTSLRCAPKACFCI